MKKKSKKFKILTGITTVVVVVVLVFVWITTRPASTMVIAQTPQTVTLAKSDMQQHISLSGVVKSETTTNIYSTQTYPVKEVYVSVGDAVKTGDVLAILDMSKLENDIAQAEINYNSALASAAEDERQLANSITNAATSLEASQISLAKQQLSTANAERDLREAEEKTTEPFDNYSYDLAIEDARVALERKEADLLKAKADLDEAVNEFDDYTYQNVIKEAGITVDRKEADLAEAEKNLTDEKNGKIEKFDDYTYQNAISDAQKSSDRKKAEYQAAQDSYYAATNEYYAISVNPLATSDAINKALSNMEAAQAAMDTAKRAAEEAEDKADRAYTDLSKARSDYNKTAKDSKEDKIDAAQKAYDNAAGAVDDAKRAYDKAVMDLERAKRDAVSNASDKLTTAQNAVTDAERTYEKTLNDKERAINDYIENNDKSLQTAQKALADSQKQLQSSQNNVKSAQNTLEQTGSKPVTSQSNVELQALNLEKLHTQLAEGKIVATADGVITESNIKVGATPSGILFVIEDLDRLYVSANIKEYNLSSVSLGQKAQITTDATGDKTYNATLSYISPKAVSAAGSTSVEFEIRADIAQPDTAVKIGMNAFMNIITLEKTDVYAVPLSIIVSNERGNFVYTGSAENVVEIPVTLGVKTSTSVEIIGEGLYDGMELSADPEGKIGQGGQPGGFPFNMGRR